MLRRNRSTRSGGFTLPERLASEGGAERRRGPAARCARSRAGARRAGLAHVPTLMQVRALAHFDGREPCSYLLDPTVNYVPELPLGGEDPLGRHALCFTGATRTAGGGSSW